MRPNRQTTRHPRAPNGAAPQLSPEEQKLFSTWRYISPQTLRIEMGISKEMDDMEATFKASHMEVGGEKERGYPQLPAQSACVD